MHTKDAPHLSPLSTDIGVPTHAIPSFFWSRRIKSWYHGSIMMASWIMHGIMERVIFMSFPSSSCCCRCCEQELGPRTDILPPISNFGRDRNAFPAQTERSTTKRLFGGFVTTIKNMHCFELFPAFHSLQRRTERVGQSRKAELAGFAYPTTRLTYISERSGGILRVGSILGRATVAVVSFVHLLSQRLKDYSYNKHDDDEDSSCPGSPRRHGSRRNVA